MSRNRPLARSAGVASALIAALLYMAPASAIVVNQNCQAAQNSVNTLSAALGTAVATWVSDVTNGASALQIATDVARVSYLQAGLAAARNTLSACNGGGGGG